MSVVLHITPAIPPAICGVGDYATLVGGWIEKVESDVRCGYVELGWKSLADSESRSKPDAAMWETLGFERDRLVAQSTDGGDPGPISLVVHYSGYGYSSDGAPEWLADALESPPDGWRGVRMVTFFHELYATGMPWRRAFWQSGRQRHVAQRVARASNALITNREQAARWLETTTGRPRGSVPHLPVPSNVGEPEEVPPYEARPARAVVFGGVRHKRPFLVGRGARRTARTCRLLQITRLTDIGAVSPIERKPFEQAGVEVIQTGYLPKEKVSALLLDARVGFISYFPGYLNKSGVFGAFSAHGLAMLGDTNTEKELSCLLQSEEPESVPALAANRARITNQLRSRGKGIAHAAMLCEMLRNPSYARTNK